MKAVGLGAMLALSAAAPAAERAHSVVETVQLGLTPVRTWDALKDFSAWQGWHPAFAATKMVKGDGHTPGSVRVLITKDGGQFTEELVAFDPAARSYQYRIAGAGDGLRLHDSGQRGRGGLHRCVELAVQRQGRYV